MAPKPKPAPAGRRRLIARHRALAELAKTDGSRGGSLEAIVRRVTETGTSALDVARVGVWRFAPDRTRIVCVDAFDRRTGRHESGDALEVGSAPLYVRAVSAGSAIAAEDARRDPRTRRFTATYFAPHGIVSTLDVPVIVDGRAQGVVCYERAGRKRPWRPEDRLFAVAVAGLLAQAIEREERLRAEAALRESESRLRRFVDDLPAGAVWVEGGRVFANRGVEPITGYGAGELDSIDAWFEKLYPGRAAASREYYGRLKAAGFPQRVVSPVSRKDGSERLVEYTAFLEGSAEVWLVRDVTEAERLARLMEHTEGAARIGGWVLDLRTEEMFWTPEIYRIAGVEPGAFRPSLEIGRKFLAPEAAEEISAAMARCIETGGRAELVVPIVAADGRRLRVRVIADAERREDGGVRLRGSVQDVTEIDRAEEERRESERRFRQLTENISEVFWMTSPDKSEMYYVSPAYERIWGRSVRSIHEDPRSWLDAIHPQDRERVFAAAVDKQGAGTYDEEYRIVRPDGSIRWIRDRAFPVRDPAGSIYRIAGLAQDITEKKRAEDEIRELSGALEKRVEERTRELGAAYDALRASEQRMRQIIDLVPHFVFAKDGEGRFILVNRAVADVYGTTVEDLLGRTDADFARSAAEAEAFRRDDLDVIRGGRPKLIPEERITAADGKVRWLQTLKIPFLVSGTGAPAVLGVSTDITARRQAEAERAELELQLRRAQKMEAIGTLAGGIAHDFNNILTAILGYGDILERRFHDDPDAARQLGEIVVAARRARDLVQQILTFSRQQEQQRTVVRLQATVEEAMRLLRAAIPSTVAIRSDVDPAAPAVLADPTRIHQVVMNLATNAAAAMEGRPGILDVSLAPVEVDDALAATHPDLRPGRYARLSVRDTGHGMDSATLERIFEPFFTTKGPSKGTGLGLAVVHGIVKDHDGAVIVESRKGRGTVFHVYLPAAEALPSEAAVHAGALRPGKGQRVMCVDDERTVVELLGSVLENLGYEPVLHTEPSEALSDFRRRPEAFHLIITDLAMPALSGLELAREMLRVRSDVPIILSTGFSGEVTEDHVRTRGLRRLLLKPFTLEQIGDAVHEVLSGDRRTS